MAKRQRRLGLHTDPNQFILPLFIALEFNEKLIESVASSVIEEIRHEQPNYDEWSEAELINLHVNLLEQSLVQAFNPRSGKSARKDVVDWISRLKEPGKKNAPFSFPTCCQLAGYNPDDLRDNFHEEMKFRGIWPSSEPKA